MDKEAIIQSLRELAQYLELDGENPFKIRSYLKSAEILEHIQEPIETLIESGTLRNLEGIGEAIEKKILAWYHDEPVPALEKVKSKYPSSLLELFSVQSLGAKRIRSLFDNLQITNLDDLYKACLEGKVSTVTGFNKKIENKIIESIDLLKQWKGQFLLSHGYDVAKKMIEKLKNILDRDNIYIAGSLRRYEETIRNINLLLLTEDKETIKQNLHALFPEINKENIKSFVSLKCFDIPVLINFTNNDDFGTQFVWNTGSKHFVDLLIQHCEQKNLCLSQQGLLNPNGIPINCNTEENFFELIGLPYLSPELRNIYDDMGFVYKNADNLVKMEDIQGIVHCHTLYSDGRNSISELAEYCIHRGFRYIVICDHSQSAGYANGLSIEDIKKQHEEIEKLNSIYKPFQILKGIECDIKSDGSLDYPNEILDAFDVVIGSIHTKLDMDKTTATQRLLKAIKNPHLDILGHISGRLLLSRKDYPLEMDTLLKACSEHNVSIEINANPQRLDIDWKNIYKSKKYNIKYTISVDAHNMEGIEDVMYGVYIARKGILRPNEILNCKNVEDFKNWFKKKI
ncbi:MAG TPA: DNA polymerase/3'-5' exonuclease PolX [Candidatus Hydrogenedens sp.]|nr:DNA polymerase/3'-5' exonuclease PolX [Candidatus Hydrogenedens sp.]